MGQKNGEVGLLVEYLFCGRREATKGNNDSYFIIGLFSISEPRSEPINNCAYLDRLIGR